MLLSCTGHTTELNVMSVFLCFISAYLMLLTRQAKGKSAKKVETDWG
jgi:hypothetical protein